jgi:hypothetical protein
VVPGTNTPHSPYTLYILSFGVCCVWLIHLATTTIVPFRQRPHTPSSLYLPSLRGFISRINQYHYQFQYYHVSQPKYTRPKPVRRLPDREYPIAHQPDSYTTCQREEFWDSIPGCHRCCTLQRTSTRSGRRYIPLLLYTWPTQRYPRLCGANALLPSMMLPRSEMVAVSMLSCCFRQRLTTAVVAGRFCAPVARDLHCCLPCPATDFLYPKGEDHAYRVPGHLLTKS